MNKISKFLVEQIMLEDTDIKNTIVVYSGRFQPMHKGHFGVYEHLVKKFGKDNVFIGTSNKVDPPRSPFNFKEKKKIMTTMFPIPKDKVVQIKNPYNPVEIKSKFDENTTAFVTVVSDKDANRLGGKYFKKWTGNPTESMKTRGYVYISPMFGDNISASVVRNTLSNGDMEENRKFFKSKLYSKFNEPIFKLIIGKLHETLIITKETIEEWLLKEGTIGGVGQADDGPLAFYPNFDVFNKISIPRAKEIGYSVVNMIMTKELEDYYVHPNYPDGPVKAVSFYPAGVIGKMTPNNQVDIYSSGAYSQWYKHVNRKASLAGYELVQTQIEKSIQKKIKKMSGKMAKADKEIEDAFNNIEFEELMNEAITLPVEIGDTLLMGKWKNKKVVVKTIGVDDHGMPTINGKKVVTFRLGKKGPNIFDNIVELEHKHKWKNLGISRENMPQVQQKNRKKYFDWLSKKGISYKKEKVDISKINLTQKDINPEIIGKIKNLKNIKDYPILISKDNYILDGHHRTVLFYNNGIDKIDTIRVNLPIKKLLKLTHTFPDVTYKKINEDVILTEATNKLKINIPSNIKKLQKMFKKNGFKLYIVGGAVRDAILGQKPKDFDLATNAKPDEVLKIARMNGLHTSEVGKSFGVVIVDGDEIATFRKDVGSGRRPDSVDYTDIEGDVKRRDLTINALFYDLDREEIVDLVGGIADLHKKNIRTVGKAEERFEEDPLRRLRAFRFHARIGGKMDKDTEAALKNNVSLNGVSPERIRDEFLKSIKSAKSVKKYFETIEKYGYLKLILPNLKINKKFIEETDYKVLLAYLLQNNTDLEKKLNKLKYSQQEGRDIEFLVNLKNFKPENIRLLKTKFDKQIHLTKPQIEKFGKLVGKDLKKFNDFKLTLKGSDIPKDLKKSDIGKWMNDEERKNYLNETWAIKGNKIEKLITGKNLSYKGKKHPEIEFEVIDTDNSNKLVTLKILAPKKYFGDQMRVPIRSIQRGPFLKTNTSGQFENVNEMAKYELDSVEKFADKKLNPTDVVFTNHFFDRLNDPRNGKEITYSELLDFFERLSKQKKDLSDFLRRFKDFTIKDKKTNINIPLATKTNHIIAKTIMRNKNWKSRERIFNLENTLNESISGKFTGSIKIGGKMITITVDLLGIDNHRNRYLTKVVDIDKKYLSKLPIGTTLPIPPKIFNKWIREQNEDVISTGLATVEPEHEGIAELYDDVNEMLDTFEGKLLPHQIIKESGKQTGGSPIPSEQTMKMYNNVAGEISKMFKITKNDIKPLGSTGKKKVGDMTGDIDMAIDAGKIGSNFKLKFDEVQEFIYNKIKNKYDNVKNSKGFGIISFLYPIPSSEDYGQVDLMLSDNLDLVSFMYHSPDFTKNESKYKGLYRNVLFTTIIKYIETGDVDKYFEDGELKQYSKYSLTGSKGLMKQLKSFEGKNGKIKNAKTIKGSDQIITQVPIEIVKFVLGDDYTVDDVKSFESIYKIMNKNSFRHKKNNKKVIEEFKEAILRLHLPLPSEIK